MSAPQATEFASVFNHFRAPPADSCYPYNPVFPTTVAGHRAVLKKTRRPLDRAHSIGRWVRRLADHGIPVVTPIVGPMANPMPIGEFVWVAYPWQDGDPYTGTPEQIAAAGDLLGRLHATRWPTDGVPALPWPETDDESIAADLDGLARVFGRHAPHLVDEVIERVTAPLRRFDAQTIPALRDTGLPTNVVSSDFKANNLVYGASGPRNGRPVLVDPDNADDTVRLLDLALALLHFHTDAPTAPGRLFTPEEWVVFRDAYLRHVTPTPAERVAWPHALEFQICDWAIWAAVDADEWDGDWQDPRQRAYFCDLLTADLDRYPL